MKEFESHLSQVEVGWPEQRLLDHAGDPDEKGSEGWFYLWEEGGVEGGYVMSYTFVLREGVVADVRQTMGHVRRVPLAE